MSKIKFLSLAEVICNDPSSSKKDLVPKGFVKIGWSYKDGRNETIKITGWSQPEKGFCGMDRFSNIRIYNVDGGCIIKSDGIPNEDSKKRPRDQSLDLIRN